ncbi:MAG: single-stranded DNA-binding protein [Moorellaceae bacterium]
MLNRSFLIGRLTADPELQYTSNGVARCTFVLAVDRRANSEGEKTTDFIPIVLWRKLAETCAAHLKKGRLVAVEGRIQSRSYETQDGARRRVIDVVADDVRFLDRPAERREEASLDGLGCDLGVSEDDLPF